MRKWWEPSPAKEIPALPWLAPAVIDRLTQIIHPNFRVIEHGCGGSTLWFAERVSSVLATDNNADFREQVNKRLDQNRARVFGSITDIHGLDDKFDLLLIDGEPLEDRTLWLNAAPQIVKSGGWVVLDNANRPHYAKERQWLQAQAEHFETYDGNEGGTIYLVTEFYRLK